MAVSCGEPSPPPVAPTHHTQRGSQGFYAPQFLPTSRGFDKYFGFLSGCEDHVNQENCCAPCNRTRYGIGKPVDLYDSEKGGPALGENGTNNAFLFSRKAVEMIENHASTSPKRPLFMYLSLHNTHAPFQVPDRFSNLYNFSDALQNTWSGMVSMVDETLLNVTSAFKRNNLWGNCLMIMCGDK